MMYVAISSKSLLYRRFEVLIDMSVKEGSLKKLEVKFDKRLEEQTRALEKEMRAEMTFLEDKLRAEITLVEEAISRD